MRIVRYEAVHEVVERWEIEFPQRGHHHHGPSHQKHALSRDGKGSQAISMLPFHFQISPPHTSTQVVVVYYEKGGSRIFLLFVVIIAHLEYHFVRSKRFSEVILKYRIPQARNNQLRQKFLRHTIICSIAGNIQL